MKFIITGRLSSMNDYTLANRSNKFGGAQLKRKNEKIVKDGILESRITKVTRYPIKLKITWYEPNSRRDCDNIQAGTKFIQDALVQMGIIEDDSQKYINALEHIVKVDKENPRIEVEIIEN